MAVSVPCMYTCARLLGMTITQRPLYGRERYGTSAYPNRRGLRLRQRRFVTTFLVRPVCMQRCPGRKLPRANTGAGLQAPKPCLKYRNLTRNPSCITRFDP